MKVSYHLRIIVGILIHYHDQLLELTTFAFCHIQMWNKPSSINSTEKKDDILYQANRDSDLITTVNFMKTSSV